MIFTRPQSISKGVKPFKRRRYIQINALYRSEVEQLLSHYFFSFEKREHNNHNTKTQNILPNFVFSFPRKRGYNIMFGQKFNASHLWSLTKLIKCICINRFFLSDDVYRKQTKEIKNIVLKNQIDVLFFLLFIIFVFHS